MTLALDFDGTLISANLFPDLGPLRSDWKPILDKWNQLGYHMFIWSCRTNPTIADVPAQIQLLTQWKKDNDVDYLEIETGQQGKVCADFHIDDRAIFFHNNFDDLAGFIDAVASGVV